MTELLTEADVRRIVRDELARIEFEAAKREPRPPHISKEMWDWLCTPCEMKPLTLEDLERHRR